MIHDITGSVTVTAVAEVFTTDKIACGIEQTVITIFTTSTSRAVLMPQSVISPSSPPCCGYIDASERAQQEGQG